jgi:2-polyprenyl-3-methyl-5-hydroxy-6-metoxy-1,4-benzoquinol methylase
MTLFDQHASSYSKQHSQSISSSGEDIGYFAQYKIDCLKRVGICGKILDFGCGIGNVTRVLSENFDNVYGYDPSEISIEIAKSSLPMVKFYTKYDDLPKGVFDAIVVAGVFHHIPKADRLSIARDIKMLLKAEGTIVIFEHNPYNPLTKMAVEKCAFDIDAVLLTPKDVISLLRLSEYVLLRQKYIVFFPRFLKWFRFLEPYLGWLPIGAQTFTTGIRSWK